MYLLWRYTAKSEIIFHGMSNDYIHISIYIFNNVTFVMSVRWKRHLRWKRFKDLHASTSALPYMHHTLFESSFAYNTCASKINPFLFVGVIIKHMWCAVRKHMHISLHYHMYLSTQRVTSNVIKTTTNFILGFFSRANSCIQSVPIYVLGATFTSDVCDQYSEQYHLIIMCELWCIQNT